MGADYTAIAILGLELDTSVFPFLKATARVPAFEHAYSHDIEYHPKTGQKLWTDETKEIDSEYKRYFMETDGIYERFLKPGQDVEDLDEEEIDSKLLCNFDDYGLRCFIDEDEDCWVGVIADDTGSNGGEVVDFTPVPEDLKDTLIKVLEPYGLWKEEKYGLYTYLSCSV